MPPSDNPKPIRDQRLGARKPGRPPGIAGPQRRTVRRGRLVREAIEDGTPLAYIAACLASRQADPDVVRMWGRPDAKTLRRWLRKADEADDLPSPERRSASPAVGYARRAFHAHSAEHHERYCLYDASGYARRSAPAAYWESLAILCELRCAFEHAMAEASAREPKDWTSRQMRLAVAHRARAERLRDSAEAG